MDRLRELLCNEIWAIGVHWVFVVGSEAMSLRESWERFRQEWTEASRQYKEPEFSPLSIGLGWAGIGALFGALTADDPWNGGVIGAAIGFGVAMTVQGLIKIPRLRRWAALAVGVLLVVVNGLPETSVRRGYFWSEDSRWLVAIGAVLILFAVLTKPKDELF